MAKIAVISPSSRLTAVAELLLSKQELPVVLAQASQTTAVTVALGLIESGVNVIVSRGKTAELLRERFQIPIVEVRHTFFDCFHAYKKARIISDKIAFLATSEAYVKILKKSRPFLNDALICSIDPFDSAESTEAKLDDLVSRGVKVAIGGLSLQEAVVARGLHYIMSYADPDATNDAINDAMHLMHIEEERSHKRLELQSRHEMIGSILNCVSEGILSIDRYGVITKINSVATGYVFPLVVGDSVNGLAIFNYFSQVLECGKPIHGVLIDLGLNSLIVSIAPIQLGNQVIGAVATLQKQTEIKSIERKMRRELARAHMAEKTFADIIGSSPALTAVKHLAIKYAGVDSTVMIEGETGTGKELFAQSIHNASRRAKAPFVAINCAAFAPGVLESELFGYVKGAFTGALNEGKAGVFELAHTGTIFLDEISEASPEIQVKLLRTLQERKVVRMGDNKITPIDIRIITASNKNLSSLVAQGTFREDFYYRICVLQLSLPPLRDRWGDIPELARFLLKQHGMQVSSLSDSAINRLSQQEWRGNIRQLSNALERLVVMGQDGKIDDRILSLVLQNESGVLKTKENNSKAQGSNLDEMTLLLQTLSQVRGNRQRAACSGQLILATALDCM